MQTKRQIQELLSAAGVSPNRRLGQHFLVDLNLLRLLVDSADPGPGDVVLEVGCGTGSLTEALAERAGAVVAVEIDPTLADIARQRLTALPGNQAGQAEGPACSDPAKRSEVPISSLVSRISNGSYPRDTSNEIRDTASRSCGHAASNVQIINADVLSGKGTLNPAVVEAVARARRSGIDIPSASSGQALPVSFRVEGVPPSNRGQDARDTHGRDAHATPGRLLLVSNLPYDVASPVVIGLVKGPLLADAMFVTVQKEVAERMTARPGSREYGTLSIFLQATGEVEVLRVLRPSVFWPPPGVDSAMVRFLRNKAKSARIEDMAVLSEVVAGFMGHRRKMLRACLRSLPPGMGDPDRWMGLLERLGIDPTLRPGDLTPDQYVALANAWHTGMYPG